MINSVYIGRNIFESKAVLTNTVNCVGVMGKGLALKFKIRYPEMYLDYERKCRSRSVKPGIPYVWRPGTEDNINPEIINFPTKNHWRDPSQLKWIVQGLEIILYSYKEWKMDYIAIPPLGCGLGGLRWTAVYPVICEKLGGINDLKIDIYAPENHLEYFPDKQNTADYTAMI